MVPNCATTEDLLKTIKDEKVQMIDLRFTDLPALATVFLSRSKSGAPFPAGLTNEQWLNPMP